MYNENKSVASCTFTKRIIRLSTLLKRCKNTLKDFIFLRFGENRDEREKENKTLLNFFYRQMSWFYERLVYNQLHITYF